MESGDTLTLELLLKTATLHKAVQAQLESRKSRNVSVNLVCNLWDNKKHQMGKKSPSGFANKTCYSTVFSKLDLRWGYHQLELHPESRSITTFAAHCELYHYKCLMFGISSAPKVHQHVIQQTLQGCEGVANISYNIIVHGSSTEKHDTRLERVLERMKEKNLTDKCRFRTAQLVFMGLILSDKGIGPADDKVRAILDARKPQKVSEVRSFLGLANYNAQIIPDFATIAEPLRDLPRKASSSSSEKSKRKCLTS